MFTGIIERLAPVVSLRRGARATRLAVDLGELARGVPLGDSIAINGACLTVASVSGATVEFDVVAETLDRTDLGQLRPGDRVNTERSLRIGDRLAGHFVQGHVDATGTIKSIRRDSEGGAVTVAAGAEIMDYVVEKGSVAIDGISLTVASLTEGDFTVAVIPTTLQLTTLGIKTAGNAVNLETDILAKLVARLLRQRKQPEGITENMLRDQGFA